MSTILHPLPKALSVRCVFSRFQNAAQDWLDEHYLGAFASREECVRKLVDDYGLAGDIETLTAELFETELDAETENGVVHVFSRQ